MTNPGERSAEGQLPPDFVRFHRRHATLWLRVAHLELGAREPAAEVVEQSLIELATVWERASGPVEPLAWRMLRRHIVRHMQRSGRTSAFVSTAAFDPAAFEALRLPPKVFDTLEHRIALFTAVHELPRDHHEVFLLTRVLGQSNQDAARLLGIREKTVRELRRDAIALLMQGLSEDDPDTATAARRVLHLSRDQLAELDGPIGLFRAIARLPDRQFEAMTLRYVLEYSDETAGRLLGMTAATVRSNVRHAKETIARTLGLPEIPDPD
ncbi:RNA polymerase sigma factor [Embleya sp. NPDC020630]|uniref:RNA polymerase sigma factor n=1 Tax=Embleya sp. NPDC020630 TaxID=3363979 RepID=UPI003790AA11